MTAALPSQSTATIETERVFDFLLDHSQIVQLECQRSGVWGRADLWGKLVTYKG